MEYQNPAPQEDLLADYENVAEFNLASNGTRLGGFIVDIILFYVITFVLAYAIAVFSPETALALFPQDESNPLLEMLVTYLYMIIFYSLLEGFTKGRSLGKLVTRTKVVRTDGSQITFKDAFLRSLCRVVPFEALSILWGPMWHDKWTNTMVVDKRSA